MEELKNLKNKNVYFTALKINASTDVMFSKMESSFGKNFGKTREVVP